MSQLLWDFPGWMYVLLSSLENYNLEGSAACYSWQLKWKGVHDFRRCNKRTRAREEALPPSGFWHLILAASQCQAPGADLFSHECQSEWTLGWVHPTAWLVYKSCGRPRKGKKTWCQSQKSLQFQLHTRKPTRTDLARCFLIIIHFPLLMWLNKYN